MNTKMKKGRLTGKVLSGRFRLEMLQEGGQSGEIYEAMDLAGDGRVTVAVFSGGPLSEPERLEDLSRGIQDLFGLSHASLGQIISQHLTAHSHRKGEPHYLVVAEQDGIPLDAYIRENGPLRPEMAAFIMLQVTGALEALHARGVCHGGLSAGRVYIRPEHLLHDDHVRVHLPVVSGVLLSAAVSLLEEDKHLTAGEAARLPYAAPEALLNEQPTAAGDIYAAGALLYLCLTGQAAIPNEAQDADPAGLRDSLLFGGPPPISEVSPDLSHDVIQLVTRCLAKDADERPTLLDELQEVLTRHAPEAVVTDCAHKDEPARAKTGSEATAAPPISPEPRPIAYSLRDAQREAALHRPSAPESKTPPSPPAADDPQLDIFDTIAMAAPQVISEIESDHPAEDTPEGAPIPDNFPTISMPSPFIQEPSPPTPVQKVPTTPDTAQPDLQPAGEQTHDFSTVLLSMDELGQEATAEPPATESREDEPQPDLDPDDAMFNSVELSVEDLRRMKDGEKS